MQGARSRARSEQPVANHCGSECIADLQDGKLNGGVFSDWKVHLAVGRLRDVAELMNACVEIAKERALKRRKFAAASVEHDMPTSHIQVVTPPPPLNLGLSGLF